MIKNTDRIIFAFSKLIAFAKVQSAGAKQSKVGLRKIVINFLADDATNDYTFNKWNWELLMSNYLDTATKFAEDEICPSKNISCKKGVIKTTNNILIAANENFLI